VKGIAREGGESVKGTVSFSFSISISISFSFFSLFLLLPRRRVEKNGWEKECEVTKFNQLQGK